MTSRPFLSSFLCVAFCTFALATSHAEDAKPQTNEVKASDLTLQVPATWKQQQPSNNLRLAQFLIPAPKDGLEAAELVVSGPFGGSAAQNIQRWIGQFAPAGREAKMTQGESGQGKYVLVDMTGTYNRSVGPPILRKTEAVENYRVINVMISVTAGRGGNYFLKLSGPNETIESVADQLRATFGAAADKEKPFEL